MGKTNQTNQAETIRLLVADDEDFILETYRKIFSDGSASNASYPKFEVDFCHQAEEAVDKVKEALESDGPFVVCFIDIRMPPGPDGIWAAEQIRSLSKDIHIVIVTGFSDISSDDITNRIPPADKLLYLQKPLHTYELTQLARALSSKCGLEEKLVRANEELETKVQKRTAELTAANDELRREIEYRRNAEQELGQARQKLEDYDNLNNSFAVNVSHELRTPLTIFKNIVCNMHDGVLGNINERQRENLKTVDKEIDRLARIISDFLDISEIEAGKLQLFRKKQTIQSIVEDAIASFKPLTKKKNVELKAGMPEEELFVNVDRGRIFQVIFNLIDNAIKFVPEIGANIIVRVKDLDNEICIDVEDNGPGIEGDDISKVFNRFVQIEKQIGPGAHGTGLGLAICKELIEMHNGRIWVENKTTGGADFCFVLPKFTAESKKTSGTCSGHDKRESEKPQEG